MTRSPAHARERAAFRGARASWLFDGGPYTNRKPCLARVHEVFLPRAAGRGDQMHRESVEQFVGKMDAAERTRPRTKSRLWLQRTLLRGQVLSVACCSCWRRGFGSTIQYLSRAYSSGENCLHPREHVVGELPVVRAFLDDGETHRPVHPQPHFLELLGHQFAEDAADADARVKIAPPPDPRPARRRNTRSSGW